MTLLVASLTDPSIEAMRERARGLAASGAADLVEARLDRLANPEGALRDLAAFPLPVVATLRPAWEGGSFEGDEARREKILTQAVEEGTPYVDVEARAAFADALLARASGRSRVILSRHDFEGTPPADEIVAFLREARGRGAWCGKLACRTNRPEDALSLVEAASRAARERLSAAIMAVNDPFLRLLAPSLGLALAYAAPDAGAAAAPGQLPARDARRVHAALPAPRAQTRTLLLLGHPVSHSLSPVFQNAALRAAAVDARYLAWDVPPQALAATIDALRSSPSVLGANVTIPHKLAAASLVDRLDASARQAGAVNTLVRDGDRLVGHSTDGPGALRALAEAGVEWAGRRALLLGAGGAARAVAFALRADGASLALSNRSIDRARSLAADVGGQLVPFAPEALERAAKDADLLVNCTTVGLARDESPVPPGALRPGLAVLDAVYRPGGTRLVRDARAAGAAAVPGDAMLLHQGALAFELWTGERAPLAAMRSALAEAVA